VVALRAWIDSLEAKGGMLFRSVVLGVVGTRIDRSGKFVARTVKRYAKAAGIDPTKVSGHSLRSGFVTEAIRQHRDPAVVRKTTRHASDKMLAKYIRERDVFDLNAAKGMA
jgi:integrase